MSLSIRGVAANAVYVLLAGAIVADVTLLSYLTALRHRTATESALFVRDVPASATGLPPRGYSDADIEAPPSSMSDKGWAVRYTSPGCKFSRADEPRWNALKSELVAGGYHIYDIAPYPLKQPSKQTPGHGHKDETPIAFIDVGWMKQYRLTGTPTTLIFDRRGKIIWAHIGTMDAQDQTSALRAISSALRASSWH